MSQDDMPLFDKIGTEFVKQYYLLFESENRGAVSAMYHPDALLTFENSQVQGPEPIKQILMTKLSFNRIIHEITTLDCQPITDPATKKMTGVLVLVVGRLKCDEDPPLPFSQVFLLQEFNGAFFVMHDIFRLSIHNTA